MAKARTTRSKAKTAERFPATDEQKETSKPKAPAKEKSREELDKERTITAEKMILEARQQLVDAMLLMQKRQHNAGTKYSNIQKAIKSLQVFQDA